MPTVTYTLPIKDPLASLINVAGTETPGSTQWIIKDDATGRSLVLIGMFNDINGTGTITGFELKTTFNGFPTNLVIGSGLSLELGTFLAKLDNSSAVAYLLSDSETVTGSMDADLLEGFAGDDVLNGALGQDTLYGGEGDDDLYGGSGNDIQIGGGGNDNLYGFDGQDTLTGGTGDDSILAMEGDDLILFNAGDAGANSETVYGGPGSDIVRFNGSASIPSFTMNEVERLEFGAAATVQISQPLNNGVANLVIAGSAGVNVLALNLLTKYAADSYGPYFDFSAYTFQSWGPEDRFSITGSAEADIIRGPQKGSATLDGGAGDDLITGGIGADTLTGGVGFDTLIGGKGNDTYLFDGVDEVLETASGGTDTILSLGSLSLAAHPLIENLGLVDPAAKTSAKLTGNALANTLTGDAGANTLAGGLGKDKLYGQGGKDFFLFNTALSQTSNVDTIYGFVVKDDTIKLENAVFKALGKAGQLHTDKFYKGRAAADAEDRIVYDSKTGSLYYDPDGVGGAAQIRFATLSKGLGLTYKDFSII